jgi:hypothetical protein
MSQHYSEYATQRKARLSLEGRTAVTVFNEAYASTFGTPNPYQRFHQLDGLRPCQMVAPEHGLKLLNKP